MHLPGVFIYWHTKNKKIPQADYGEKKNSAVKLKTKQFDRSFSALGEISNMVHKVHEDQDSGISRAAPGFARVC